MHCAMGIQLTSKVMISMIPPPHYSRVFCVELPGLNAFGDLIAHSVTALFRTRDLLAAFSSTDAEDGRNGQNIVLSPLWVKSFSTSCFPSRGMPSVKFDVRRAWNVGEHYDGMRMSGISMH